MKARSLVWPGLPIALIGAVVTLDVVMIAVASVSPPVPVDRAGGGGAPPDAPPGAPAAANEPGPPDALPEPNAPVPPDGGRPR